MILDKKFRGNWKDYILQSAYAALTVLFITLILNLQHAVIIASIGSTAFIVFSMPNSIISQPRSIIGGHVIGFIRWRLFFNVSLFRLVVFFRLMVCFGCGYKFLYHGGYRYRAFACRRYCIRYDYCWLFP